MMYILEFFLLLITVMNVWLSYNIRKREKQILINLGMYADELIKRIQEEGKKNASRNKKR